MAERLVALDGSTFFVSDPRGDVEAVEAEGFFHDDVRHLSTWQLLVDGSPIRLLSAQNPDYYSATVFGTLAAARVGVNPPIVVRRDRFVGLGVHEDVILENHSDQEHAVTVELRFASDFADIFEVKDRQPKRGRTWVELGGQHVTLWYERDGFRRLFQPELARTTLEALAELQATEDDPFRDAEPGKILHELRRGELATVGEVPHRPYYGTHDATPLFLVLLDEYERWTGDAALVRRLEPAARAALAWIEGPGDPDGDGYLEYRRRSPKGLDNQGWKDSANAIVFADGRLAPPPVATCEIQGYAYDARRRTARLARDVWLDESLASRLDADAEKLRDRFNRDFWHDTRGHYVLALDGTKAQVDSLTSNTGHLLWSGIVDEERASLVIERIMAPDMFSGWGVRTLSTADAGYNPIEYHNGTVWPHDTALVAEGMRRYGFRAEASTLALALIEAAEAFGFRLPEVFAGFDRGDSPLPVEYPSASCPQAWAAGSVLLALRTLLGLDVADGRLQASPHLLGPCGELRLQGIPVRGRRIDTGV